MQAGVGSRGPEAAFNSASFTLEDPWNFKNYFLFSHFFCE